MCKRIKETRPGIYSIHGISKGYIPGAVVPCVNLDIGGDRYITVAHLYPIEIGGTVTIHLDGCITVEPAYQKVRT